MRALPLAVLALLLPGCAAPESVPTCETVAWRYHGVAAAAEWGERMEEERARAALENATLPDHWRVRDVTREELPPSLLRTYYVRVGPHAGGRMVAPLEGGEATGVRATLEMHVEPLEGEAPASEPRTLEEHAGEAYERDRATLAALLAEVEAGLAPALGEPDARAFEAVGSLDACAA